MTSDPIPGFPEDVLLAHLGDAAATFTFDDAVYPLEAAYGAAYIFIDRCFVLLDRPEPGKLRVVLSAKKPPATAEQLRALAGEFANELLSCAWRHQITAQNRAVIEQVTSQALSGAMGPPSLEELEDFDFSGETFEDPLGIAMSWEDKYKKNKAGEPGPQGGNTP